MSSYTIHRRRRVFRILRLFFSLVAGFFLQYARARVLGRRYDFFADSRANRRRAIRLRETALSMGGVLIKVGQFLSARVDVLPSEYIEELALLQDEVPPVPFHEIRPILESDLGAPIPQLFAEFETSPVAAASLGQVYEARLHTGDHVAVKVQRPHIDEIIEADLGALRYIVGWLMRHTSLGQRVDLPLVLREFEATLSLELEYGQEAHHAERMAVELAGTSQVVIPRVYWSRTAGRVLTMQFMTGVQISDTEAIDRAGISRPDLAEILLTVYLYQIVEAGFFHADPHPGNLMVQPGPRIIMLDFGMVGSISPAMRANLRRIFLGIVRRDYDEILDALDHLGFIPPGADPAILRDAIAWTVTTFYRLSFDQLKAIDPTTIIDRLQEVLYTESVRLPANYAFLGRAVGTLTGLCTALDPSFQFVTVAEPYARNLLSENRGVFGTARRVGEEALSLARTAYSLPYLTSHALERVQEGEMTFRREVSNVVRAVEDVERVIRRLLFALLVAALLVGGSFVYHSHPRAALIFAIGSVLLIVIGMLAPFPRGRRRP